MSADLVLYYWPLKARAYASLAIAKAGNVKLTLKSDFDLGAMKASGELPFGQLPYLVHGDVKLAQSGAINRYVAKLAGLTGDNDVEYALSEMLSEEAADIYNLLVKANYSGNKNEAFDALFAAHGPFETQMKYLEKLHPGTTPFFKAPPGKPLAGGITLAAVLDMAVHVHPTCLEATPKIKSFHQAFMKSEYFQGFDSFGFYFART